MDRIILEYIFRRLFVMCPKHFHLNMSWKSVVNRIDAWQKIKKYNVNDFQALCGNLIWSRMWWSKLIFGEWKRFFGRNWSWIELPSRIHTSVSSKYIEIQNTRIIENWNILSCSQRTSTLFFSIGWLPDIVCAMFVAYEMRIGSYQRSTRLNSAPYFFEVFEFSEKWIQMKWRIRMSCI